MDIEKLMQLKPAYAVLFEAATVRPEQARFVSEDGSLVTYGAFAQGTEELAAHLISTGLTPKDRAVVFAPNRPEWAMAGLAIQAAHGCLVPVYPASTSDQVRYVVGHADATVVFVDSPALLEKLLAAWVGIEAQLAAPLRAVLLDPTADASALLASAHEKLAAAGVTLPSLETLATRVLGIGQARAQGRVALEKDPELVRRTGMNVSLDDAGLMLYTSGTTGNPKGVPLTHRNVGSNGADWLVCNQALLREGATDILWLPMSHIFGFGQMCLGNSLGWTSVMADPVQALKKLPEVRPDVFFSVPSHWEKLAQGALALGDANARKESILAATGGKLTFCLSGGAGLKREVKEVFFEAGILIVEGYGLTESSPTLTLNRPDAFRFDSVGKPLPSVELRLAEDGEILAKGPNVFSGYHKDQAATREAFTEDGWLKTGDVGQWTEDGFLQIIDRKKDILVTAGGKNVPPANIEMRFAGDADIAHTLVYGDGKKFLVLGIWPTGDLDEDAFAEKVAMINAELPSYETIKKYVLIREPLTVENGMLTSSFKLRRKIVTKHFASIFEALYDK
jgi:long-chain acyl-CoA synthetase